MENRITDPKRISNKQLDEILSRGVKPTIQFSKPGFSRQIIKATNKLCAKYGSDLEVRFYGHYSDAFDASILKLLPEVQWLSIDCLSRIENEDVISELLNLRKLSFGVYYFDRPDFLANLDLSSLIRLALPDNHKKNFDLSPLVNCDVLDELFISGHRKNILTLSKLPKLRKLSLGSISKRQTLEFVNQISSLEVLTIILGGRENFNEVMHSNLRGLEVLRVRGINTLGDLSRFPGLHRLQVEDQIQLRSMSVVNTSLEEISVHNCKNLNELHGLLDLSNLRSFRTSRTKLDLDYLLNVTWPNSMQTVALYSGSKKWNKQARKILDEKGYNAFSL